ncbi:hypothetical protein GCM10028803_34910 [Larkinella knui]|uniref:Outer membrane protein beta-barrel domain-containing protein n=1 Tax=Larkinella knui TaxID=2025310 RepID=A0A3P1CDJ0_9BACT|nr:hypothetical protein [Larkinella knui]RRB11367.1 hypothetical protein EHT87_23045 [Larkinella knui]
MATTEDEWERLFRQRLENYESEPAENALERIFMGTKPPAIEKPGGTFRRRLGWSTALLSMLGFLAIGIWQYRELSTGSFVKSPAVAKLVSKTKTAQAAMSPERGRLTAEPTDAKTDRSEPRGSQQLPQTEVVFKPGMKSPARTAMPVTDEPLSEGGMAQKRRRKPDLPDDNPVRRDRPTATDQAKIETEHRTKQLPDEVNFTTNQSLEAITRTAEEKVGKPELVFRFMAGKTTRLSFPAGPLPAIPSTASNNQTSTIEPERVAVRPSYFASVMPLYTYRQVTPVRHDEVVMEKIRTATSFSARTGWRVQAGAEWPLSRSLGLRVGAVYQQLQQQLTYSTRALRSDSSKVEWIDQQTIKLTPLYKSEEHHVKTTWQYVALSAEGRLYFNPDQSAGLRHSIAAGGSVGYLISGRSKQRWQPFLQASYSIERRLTENLRLQVEPGIVYNLTAINDNSRCFSVRPYSYGLVIGLHWHP